MIDGVTEGLKIFHLIQIYSITHYANFTGNFLLISQFSESPIFSNFKKIKRMFFTSLNSISSEI